jgi:hypothetical protein
MDKFKVIAEELIVNAELRGAVCALIKLDHTIKLPRPSLEGLEAPLRSEEPLTPARNLARDGLVVWERLTSDLKLKSGIAGTGLSGAAGAIALDAQALAWLSPDNYFVFASKQFGVQVFAEYLLSMGCTLADSRLGSAYARAALQGYYEKKVFGSIVADIEYLHATQWLSRGEEKVNPLVLNGIGLLLEQVSEALPLMLRLTRFACLKFELDRRPVAAGNLFSQASLANWYTTGEGDVRLQLEQAEQTVNMLAMCLAK